jgi:hypothetical protein
MSEAKSPFNTAASPMSGAKAMSEAKSPFNTAASPMSGAKRR